MSERTQESHVWNKRNLPKPLKNQNTLAGGRVEYTAGKKESSVLVLASGSTPTPVPTRALSVGYVKSVSCSQRPSELGIMIISSTLQRLELGTLPKLT